jgi:hypothetical protein
MIKRLDTISKYFEKWHYYFLGVVFLFAIFFRLTNINNFGVGFDQVQILENANKIINKDISLIGPRTGPADMFTGPLIYYFTVPFILFFGEFSTIFLVPLSLSLITGLTIYAISKKYLNTEHSLIFTTLWAFSPFIVNLDRVFWNPNLMLLSSFLVFVPLLTISKNNQSKYIYFSLFIGSFLSYQAHFSGFLLIGLAILTLVILKKIKYSIAVLLGLVTSLVPTLIFDLRNNFLNMRGFLGLLSDKGQFNLLSYINDVLKNIYILIETLGKIFLFGNSLPTILAIGTIIITLSFLLLKHQKNIKISFLWLFIIAISYAFYKGEKPEYYFLISIPPLFYLASSLLNKLEINQRVFILSIFFVNSLFVNINFYKNNNGLTIGNIRQVEEVLANKEVKSIVYDVPYGSEIGIKHMLSNLNYDENGKIYHISFPNELQFNGITKISNIGVWSDNRMIDKNYISKNTYFLESTNEYQLFQDLYPKQQIQDFDTYVIVNNNFIVGTLAIADESKDKIDWVQECLKAKSEKNYEWIGMENNKFIKFNSGKCLQVQLTVDKLSILEQIRVF